MRYALKKPIQVTPDAVPVTEITLRESLCAGDLRGIKLGKIVSPLEMQTEDLLKIIGRLSARSEPEVNALGLEDFAALAEVVGGFLSPGSSPAQTAQPSSSTSTAPSAS